MKYKIGIIGHFGFGYDLANGQTIKTKIVTHVIEELTNRSVLCVDAHGGVKAIIPVFIGCFKLLWRCEHVMIFLTENGLKVAVPALYLFNKIFRRKLHYNVIGGWLPKFLNGRDYLVACLTKFDYIYVETNTMKFALEKLGLNNCITIPNCKELNIIKEADSYLDNPTVLRLCTFSRVMKEKGIGDLVDVVKHINEKKGKIVYELDIFGQVDKGQTIWFEQLKKTFPDYIKYGGVIAYDQSVEVLQNYFALVFPTNFYTEGVPGTIIDAYAAGLPVISSRWESFEDVVDDEITGFGYEFGNTESLESLLLKIFENPQLIIRLKNNCVLKAQEFTLDRLKKDISKYIV